MLVRTILLSLSLLYVGIFFLMLYITCYCISYIMLNFEYKNMLLLYGLVAGGEHQLRLMKAWKTGFFPTVSGESKNWSLVEKTNNELLKPGKRTFVSPVSGESKNWRREESVTILISAPELSYWCVHPTRGRRFFGFLFVCSFFSFLPCPEREGSVSARPPWRDVTICD